MTTRFAKVNNGTVTGIIVADQNFVDSLPKEENVEWVQTDRDTRWNKHVKGGTPLRGNYATIGGLYLKDTDVFCEAKPGIDWTLDEYVQWIPPIPYPSFYDDFAILADNELGQEGPNGLDVRYVWDDALYQKDKTKGWVSPDI